jgi:hypothetical protein
MPDAGVPIPGRRGGAAGGDRTRPGHSQSSSVVAPARVAGPSIAQLVILLAWTWCLAMLAHVPKEAATSALALGYGLLFLLLLPFNRWGCFLVLVSACGAEVALRVWSPMRYNTIHYATMVLLPISYVLVRPRARMPKPLICWFAMSLWFAVSVLWSQNVGHWLVWVTEYFGVASLALLTRQLATSPRRRREMALVFAFTALAVLVSLVLLSGVGSGARLGRELGMNANGVGRLGAVGILMLIISASERGRQRLLTPVNLILFLGLGIGLMLTQSRGSMLGVLGAALTVALCQPRLQHRLLGVVGCIALFGGLVLVAVKVDPTAMERRWQSTTEKEGLAGKTAGRSEIARTAGFMLRDNWMAGVGAGQFDVVYADYSVLAHSSYNNSTEAQSHSAYLKIPTEGGIVAALLFLGFYACLWIGASKLPPGQRRALARGIIVYLMIGSFSSEGIEKENWLTVGLLLVWFWENRPGRHRPAPERRKSMAPRRRARPARLQQGKA